MTTTRIIPSLANGCTGKHNKTYGVYRCPHCQGTHLTTKIEIAEKYFEPLIYKTTAKP